MSKRINTLSKKELKEMINENGFFLNFHVNKIGREAVIERLGEVEKSENAVVLMQKNQVPSGDNIEFFSGKVTTGDLNRNGYIIETDAWDWTNYKDNPQILYQHQDDKPIGRAIRLNRAGDSWDIDYFVDYNTMEEKEAYRIKNGYVNALSTGHITKELLFRNTDTGEEIDENEYMKRWWDGEDDIDKFIMVVTKAEGVENSMVTIPSNIKAMTVKNALDKYLINYKKNLMEEKNKAENAEILKNEGSEVEETKSTDETEEATENVAETDTQAENAGETDTSAENAEVEEGASNNALVDIVANLADSVAKQQEQISDLVNYIADLRKQSSKNKVLSMETQHDSTKKIDAISKAVDGLRANSDNAKMRLPLRK